MSAFYEKMIYDIKMKQLCNKYIFLIFVNPCCTLSMLLELMFPHSASAHCSLPGRTGTNQIHCE